MSVQLDSVEKAWNKDQWVRETYTVSDTWFQKIVDFSGLTPTIDAFASPGDNRVSRFWTRKDDAFSQDWSLLVTEEECPLMFCHHQLQQWSQASANTTGVFSVIESTEEHSDAQPFIQKIKQEYDDVLHQVALAKDVDPAVRGPFGVAHIELKEGAIFMKKKIFRMIGEKEEAFRKLINKLLERLQSSL